MSAAHRTGTDPCSSEEIDGPVGDAHRAVVRPGT